MAIYLSTSVHSLQKMLFVYDTNDQRGNLEILEQERNGCLQY